MEDRLTPALYLEASPASAASYAADRLPAVSACPGVARSTWWDNAHPDRTDLPRTIPELATLGVYEVDAEFAPPPAPSEVTGYHFRRYPRPAQGFLSGLPTLGLLVVLISPRSGEGAGSLRDWADFVHIRHIAACAVPGFTMITPYENVTGGEPRFMHLYELDTDDPETAFKSMTAVVQERLGSAPGQPAFDEWAWHPELRINYVNTFRRVGAQPA